MIDAFPDTAFLERMLTFELDKNRESYCRRRELRRSIKSCQSSQLFKT
ncbi:hypothetical protein AB0758_43920 [Tolypothrix bouteillei VB521301_2]